MKEIITTPKSPFHKKCNPNYIIVFVLVNDEDEGKDEDGDKDEDADENEYEDVCCYVHSTLLYNVEGWILSEAIRIKLQLFEIMWMAM